MIKHNRSDRDMKSNHGCQYNAELEFRYSSHLILSNVYALIRFVKLLAWILFHSLWFLTNLIMCFNEIYY